MTMMTDKKMPPSAANQAPAAEPTKSKTPPGAGFAEQAAALNPNQQAGPKVGMPDPKALVRDMLAQGITDENEITNELFWRANELLRGQKLKAGSPEAKQWLDYRDMVVRPEIKAAKKTTKPDKQPDKDPVEPASGDVPDAPAPAGGGAAKASKNDVYKNQNDNSYDDGEADWKGGSAGKNTCNMTALSMALISIAGSEAAAKQGVVAFLRKKGVRSGAMARVGKKTVAMDKILKDEKLIAEVQLEDLVIAAAVAVGGSYKSVTMASTILGIAKKSGLVKEGSLKLDQAKLSDPAVRMEAKQALDRGARIVMHTKKHYVYLVDVLPDGLLVHDPAGARISTGDEANLWPGKTSDKLGTWLGRLGTEERRATALRRVSQEPANAAFMARAVEVAAMPSKDKKAGKAALMNEFSSFLEMGKNNFYGLDELEAYKCRVGIIMDPAVAKTDDKQQAEAG